LTFSERGGKQLLAKKLLSPKLKGAKGEMHPRTERLPGRTLDSRSEKKDGMAQVGKKL